MTSQPILTIRDAVKSYRGVQALKGVDFDLMPAEIHAICGENGAGKSTLVKLISGLTRPDEGEIHIAGELQRRGQATAAHLVSIVYQELSIVPDLTVLENVMIGDPRLGMFFRVGRYAGEVRELLDRIGLNDIPLDIPAGKLNVAEHQLIEICRAVLRKSRILILDEPTASLSDAEIQRVFQTVRWLRDCGTAVIYISHRLPEIFALTDRITVFRNGLRILTKPTCEWDSAELVREMIGRDVAAVEPPAEQACADSRPVSIALRDFGVPGKLTGVDLEIRRGEVVGVIGQLGSGASTIAEALAGLERRYGGTITIGQRELALHSLTASRQAGIAYVTEDRGAKSLFKGATVQQNLTCANLRALTGRGIVNRKEARMSARQLATRFQIDFSKLPQDISNLSGGNQQKVAIAKSVAVGPDVLILNEPTRGVDIGARTEIYRELRALADAGMTIVFFSTDLEEIKELSERVLCVFKGKIVSDRPAWETSTDEILSDILRGPAKQGVAA